MKFSFLKTLGLISLFIAMSSCVGGGGEESVAEADFIPSIVRDIEILSPLEASSYTSTPTSFVLQGTCSHDEDELTIYVNDINRETALCSEGVFNFPAVQISWLTEGDNILKVTPSEFPGEGIVNIVLDTISTVTINNTSTINITNQSNFVATGTCSDNGSIVNGSVNVIPFSASCIAGTWTSSAINLSFLADATYVITASMIDALGNNSGNITENVLKDTTTPLPSLNFIAPASGFGSGGSVTIRVGSINAGDVTNIYTDSSCATTPIATQTSAGTSDDFVLTTPTEGSYSYYFIVTDTVPNSTPCLGPMQYVEDRTAPNDPTSVSMSSPSAGASSSDSTPEFAGVVDAGDEGATVVAFRDVLCTDQIGSGTISSGAFNVLGSLALDGSQNGLNQFYFKITDQAGNAGNCYDSGLSYTLGGGGLASLPKIAMVGNDSPSFLVSLENNNQITWIKKSDPNNPVDLGMIQKGDVISIEDPLNAADKVDQGDRIESSGACYVVTQGFGTAPWASEAYAGTSFTTYQFRYGNRSPRIYVASVTATAFVQIKQDTDGDGVLDVVAFDTIAKNDTRMFTMNLVDGRPFQVVSDQNINVYYVSSSNGVTYDRDARVLTPASTSQVGFSWYITSVEDNTTVDAYRNFSGATFNNTDLDINERMDVGRTLKSTLDRYATYVTSDKPVSMLQIADQDGINATPSLSTNMLATHYGIPRNADYVGIIALSAATVTVYDPSGNVKHGGPINLIKNAGSHANAPHALKYTDGATIPAGTTFECSTPCFMIYDDESPGADRDETLMMGFTP